MRFKKILTIGLAAVLTSLVSNVMADGLSLKSSNITSPIEVVCNGNQLPFEMQPNSAVNNLSWGLIAAVMGSSTLNCNFVLDDAAKDPVGSAQLDLNVAAGEGEATNVTYNTAYTLTVTPGDDIFAQSMTVAINKN
ncbi:MAG: hypothetical protein NTZ67_01660 [Gammaproteobacteria bacterium]|nr:hypothetical protein [Gammaproteobacteria bacterium]